MEQFTREQVALRRSAHDAAIIIDNVVYDVSGFLHEHPGGPEVLLANAGQDASQCFADIGHSETALEWRTKFRIGEVVAEERRPPAVRAELAHEPGPAWTVAGLLDACGPPLLLAALAVLVYWNYLL